MPNWICTIEVEWPAGVLPEDAETAFARLRPALEAMRHTLFVLGGGEPHWHRIGTPKLEQDQQYVERRVGELMAEQRQDTIDEVANEVGQGPWPK
jgi:hypothetical protein